MQNLRHAIRVLAGNIPKAKQSSAVQALMRKGCQSKINIVRVIMKALPNDGHMKDIDFSRSTVNARWAMGLHDIERALHKKSWLQPLPEHIGMAVHELHQE
jgi:NTE family protein